MDGYRVKPQSLPARLKHLLRHSMPPGSTRISVPTLCVTTQAGCGIPTAAWHTRIHGLYYCLGSVLILGFQGIFLSIFTWRLPPFTWRFLRTSTEHNRGVSPRQNTSIQPLS